MATCTCRFSTGMMQRNLNRLKNKVAMCAGVNERCGGLPDFFVKVDPLFAIGEQEL